MSYVRAYIELCDSVQRASGPEGLQCRGYAYHNVNHFLLTHGRAYAEVQLGRPLPPRFRVTKQMCFDNAFRLAKRDPSLRYVEGYALNVIPMEHAWCIDAQDRVIDPTWERHDEVSTDYFGVVVPVERVAAIRTKTDMAAIFNWHGRLPLLQTPFVPAGTGGQDETDDSAGAGVGVDADRDR